jgi:Cupin-like domain
MASPVKPLRHLLGKLSEEAFGLLNVNNVMLIIFINPFISSILIEYYLNSEVPVLDELPDELEFYRSYVAANRPVIVRNAINHWPALTKWNADYFKYTAQVFTYFHHHQCRPNVALPKCRDDQRQIERLFRIDPLASR